MTTNKELAVAFADLWVSSSELAWELGRLGVNNGSGYTIAVPDRPGWVYVTRGDYGELGPTVARDKVGVALVGWQRVKMRRVNGTLEIHEAEQYAGGSGSGTLGGLIDVELTGLADGEGLAWHAASGKWINVTLSGGGGAPSPHTLSGSHHSGTLDWSKLNFTGSNLADLAARAHSSLSGIGANDHHNQQHTLVGSDHTASGLTTGHTIRATGASTFAWAQLQHGDLGGITANQHHNQVHNIVGSDHTIAAAQYQLVGAPTANTVGLLTPSANPGAAVAILRTDSNGGLALGTNVFVVDGVASTVTFDATLMIVNASANTITMDTNLFVLNAGANTITSAAAWTFSGNIIANADVTHNTGTFTHNTAPQVNANIDFIGGNRSITGSNSLTLAPSTDLILDPTGLVLLPNAQELKTSTFTDLPTGIVGMRMWDRGSNYRQITLGALKADEMYVRVFVADETRIDRGEEYWSKSYGVVEEDFTLPADEGLVDVWFENAPAMASANLFSINDWILMRTIDWGTGLVVQKIWFQVNSLQVAGSVDGYRQRWRLRRKSGGTTGNVVKKGNTALCTGNVGQGWVHLSALNQDGGPFIQLGDLTSVVADEPQFTNRVRMGNLNGTVDYSTNTWGFVAGDNIGTTPSAGFSGITSDATNGARLFNTDMYLYQSTLRVAQLDRASGLKFRADTSALANANRYIGWYTSLDPSPTGLKAAVALFDTGTINELLMISTIPSGGSSSPRTRIGSLNQNVSQSMNWWIENDKATLNYDDNGVTNNIILRATRTGRFGVNVNPSSTGHFYESNSSSGAAVGVTIQNAGSGDAQLSFLQSSSTYRIGNSGGAFVFARGANLATDRVLVLSSGGDATFLGDIIAPVIHGSTAGNGDLTLQGTTSATKASSYVNIQPNGGNVGIGTITPGDLLHIQFSTAALAGIRVENLAGGTQGLAGVTFYTDGGASQRSAFFKNAAATTSYGGSNAMVFWQLANFPISLVVNNSATPQFMVANIGAGVNTTPVSPLHVYESTSNTGTNVGLTVENAGAGDAALQFLLTSSGTRWVMGADHSAASDPFVITAGANLSSAPLLGILPNGNVGIGTAAPGVDIIGTFDYSATPLLHIHGTHPSLLVRGSTVATIDLIDTGGSADARWFQIRKDGNYTYFTNLDDLGSPTSYNLIFDNANLAWSIGTTPNGSDAYLSLGGGGTRKGLNVEVYGTAQAHAIYRRALGSVVSPSSVANGSVLMSLMSSGYTSSGWATVQSTEITARATENYSSGTGGGAELLFFTRANGAGSVTERFRIGQDGHIYAPYVWNTAVNGTAVQVNSNGILTKATSSKRYKKDIRPMVGFGDDFITALKPVLYKNKFGDDPNDYVGFVAEDVYDSGGAPFISLNNGVVESLHYDKLTVPLVAATQRLIHDRASDRSELEMLKKRVADLERRLN